MSLLKTVAARWKDLTHGSQDPWDGLEERVQHLVAPLSNRLEYLVEKLDGVQTEIEGLKDAVPGDDLDRRLNSISQNIGSIGERLGTAGVKLDKLGILEGLLAELREETRRHEESRASAHKNMFEQLSGLGDGQARMRAGVETLAGTLEQLREDVTGRFVADLLPFADILEETLASGKRLLDRIPSEAPARRRFWLFGRRLESARSNWDEIAGWLRGISLLKGRLQKLIVDAGAVPIDAVGKPFDPSRHVAVETVRANGQGRNQVVAERLRGYLFGGKVLRFSRVVVTK